MMGTIVDFEQLYLDAKRRICELELVIKSHGIPVKTFAGGEAHYALGSELEATPKQQEASAMERFEQHEGYSEQDPIERLRFFCSLAMNGQDWLDVEQFFDDLRPQQGEPVAILHDDGYFTFGKGASVDLRHKSQHAGWRMEVFASEAAPRVPDGWKMVPDVATEEMLRRAEGMRGFNAAFVYQAMLAAAPEPKE